MTMEVHEHLLCAMGMASIAYRLWPWQWNSREAGVTRKDSALFYDAPSSPHVSVIIPARNEESNLPSLLNSIRELDFKAIEILVVNDQSVDRTAEVAAEHGARVIESTPPPDGWSGKNWACRIGAFNARGKYLLFTDADTIHRPDSLSRALAHLRENRLVLLSAPPYHTAVQKWERWMGPFHLLVLAATAVQQPPRPTRLFAIGQYLLFDSSYYASIRGHEAVYSDLAEDIAFARLVLNSGGRYGVYTASPQFSVRMYDGFSDFMMGWRRLFRWGLQRSSLSATAETCLHFFALTAGGALLIRPIVVPEALLYYLAGVFLFILLQKRYGDFSSKGAVAYPAILMIFLYVTILAVSDLIFKRENTWRDRVYKSTQS